MEKIMYEVSVEVEGRIISIKSPDHGMGEQGIILTVEQTPLVIKWLQEAIEEASRKPAEADEK